MTDNNALHKPSDKPASICPKCGTGLDPGRFDLACPACHQPLDEDFSTLSDKERSGLIELAVGANDRLVKAGADSAEQSFGLGCALGGLLVLAAAGFLYILGVFNIVLALIVVVMGSLAITGIAVLTASFARTRSVGINYRSTVLPEIDSYLKKNNLSRSQFDRAAAVTLPQDAPLRTCLLANTVR
jgi:hypothetical protein